MAIKKNKKVFENGVEIDNAYIKVVHLDGNKDNMYFNIQTYTSKKLADNDKRNTMYVGDIEGFRFTPDWTSNRNLLQQCYDYLKTLDDFVNTEDV